MSDDLQDKLVRGYPLPGQEKKRHPAAHREETFLCNSKLCIPHQTRNVQKGQPIHPLPQNGWDRRE